MKILDDRLTRAMYATDAGNYRVVPQAVAQVSSEEELAQLVAQAAARGQALTMRGRGTSCAGNAIGPGLVVDTSVALGKILELNAEQRWAKVQPGVVMGDLQAAAAPHGLRFGPDPSTWTRCTIGGMIGNNACGPHAQAWGRTADNVRELDIILADGRRLTAGRGEAAVAQIAGLRELVLENLALIRENFGRFRRQVSGYSLEWLLPENGWDLAKFLVGSEGTLAVVAGATVDLVPLPTSPVLLALGYADMIAAAADVPVINSFKPLAVEGMDARLVDVVRRVKGPGAVPELPAGEGWLLIEVGGEAAPTSEEALALAQQIAQAAATEAVAIYPPGADAAALWRIRADGAGLGGRTPAQVDETGNIIGGNAPAWPGWEDAAVPPENLADYLRDFTALMRRSNIDGLLYGHFGDGCVHVRLDLELGSAAGVGRSRQFLLEAARLVGQYGGSVSGEHGDGRARSELLPLIYPPAVIELFAKVKALFDPQNLLNPGVLVYPYREAAAQTATATPAEAGGPAQVGRSAEAGEPAQTQLAAGGGAAFIGRGLAEDLRLPGALPQAQRPGGFAFPRDGGDFTTAVHRCTGVAKCLTAGRIQGNWMCPSYRATGQEKDSTRGRARALQEVARSQNVASADSSRGAGQEQEGRPSREGGPVQNEALIRDYSDPALLEALDLCLSCKACSTDCPTGMDLAAFKSEALDRAYQGRPWARPRSHWLLGRLPSWLRLMRSIPGGARLGNFFLGLGPVRAGLFALFGIDQRRKMAHFAAHPFSHWARHKGLLNEVPQLATTRLQVVPEGQRGDDEDELLATEHHPDQGTPPRFVALWVDSFSEGIDPTGAQAAVEVLEAAGYHVIVPGGACCGLTAISTGQLQVARRELGKLCTVLAPFAANRIPIIGIEPSCTAVLREDLPRLLPTDPRATMISRATLTLGEFLQKELQAAASAPESGAGKGENATESADPGMAGGVGAGAGGDWRQAALGQWRLPDLSGTKIVAQPHCHHHSVMGWAADRALLQATGAEVIELSGCCGMAGNFGMEKGHYEVSVAVAEAEMLPALRAHEEALVLADGFSCRTQAAQLAQRQAVHLAILLRQGRNDRPNVKE